MGAQFSQSTANASSSHMTALCLSALPCLPQKLSGEAKALKPPTPSSRAANEAHAEDTSSSAPLADRLNALRTKMGHLEEEKTQLIAVKSAVMATIAEFAPCFEQEEDDEGEIEDFPVLERKTTSRTPEHPVEQVPCVVDESEYQRLLQEQHMLQEECLKLRAALGFAANTVTQIAEQSYEMCHHLEEVEERVRSRSPVIATQPGPADSGYEHSDTSSEHGAQSTLEASHIVMCGPTKAGALKPLLSGHLPGASQNTSSTATPVSPRSDAGPASPRRLLA